MLQKELAKRLRARYDTKMDGNGWLEVSSDGIPLCRIKYNGQFQSNANKNLSDEYRSKIADIQDEISMVREYVGLYEHAPQMKADGVSDYRQLAAFGDTVLAATYSEKNGFMFCTWKQNADGDSVFWGDYSPNYEYVKEAFAVRSGLVNKHRLFSENESAYLCRCVDFAKGNCETLTYEQERQLDKLQEKLTDGYPSLETRSSKIGREYLLTVKGCLPADDADDLKYAELGRELIQSGKGIFTEHGLLFVDEDTPFVKDYDGQNFPAYVYDQMLCFIRVEYNGKTEFLYLSCEEEAIDKAFARLGAPTPDDVELSREDICIESEKWTERFKEIAAEEGVYEVNHLANAVNSADMDLEKLWAVAEYGKSEDAKQLSRLAENLDCFTFLVGASNYEEVGIYVTENNADFSVNPSVEKFFDYKAFGKYIGDAYYGEFVDDGFISGGAVSPPPHCGYD